MVILILFGAAEVVDSAGQSAPMNIRDLHNSGLVLIGSDDAAFESAYLRLAKRSTDAAVDALKPFSVILRNETGKSVVAYSLIWEYVDSSGKELKHSVSYGF